MINYKMYGRNNLSLDEFINKITKKDFFINSVLKDNKTYLIGSEDELKGFIKSGKAKAT